MRKIILGLTSTFIPLSLFAAEMVVDIHRLTNDAQLNGIGESVGTLQLKDTEFGLLIHPSLNQLAPGMHGFHVHEKGSCDGALKDGQYQPGVGAGGHFDPNNTGKHLGPYAKEGHLGDLPHLYCDMKGQCDVPMLAPRLTVADVVGHSIMIHVHGDNFADLPASLGGGGPRLACGVVK